MNNLEISQYSKNIGIQVQQSVLDDMKSQPIVIANKVYYIADFDFISKVLPADPRINRPPLTINEYSALLFHNLGYVNYPINPLDWMQSGITIENVPKEKLPKTILPKHDYLIFNQQECSLQELLISIYLWCRGGVIETGYVVNEEKSYDAPPISEIIYKLKNHIQIKRSIVIDEEKKYWSSTDIISRRHHHLCPHINLEYSYNCIRKFSQYVDQIRVIHPCSIFLSVIIDPNILFTVIRNSEIEAARILNKKCLNCPGIRPDYHTVLLFQKIFIDKCNHIHSIIEKSGPQGLINLVSINQKKQDIISPIPNTKLEVQDNKYSYPGEVVRLDELENIDDKKKYIEMFQLDNSHIKDIFNYLDKETIPANLVEQESYDSGNTGYKQSYINMLKRVHFIFSRLKVDCPTYFDSTSKWIFSKPFYISENAFGLYNRKINLVIIAYPNLQVDIATPHNALKLYKNHYDRDILLDGEELGDALENKDPINTIVLDTDSLVSNNQTKYITNPEVKLAIDTEEDDMDKELTREEIAQLLSEKYRVTMDK